MNHSIRILVFGTLCFFACSLGAFARDAYRVSWRGTAYTRNANGTITARPYSNSEIVRNFAANSGLNPASLVLVYVKDEEENVEELEISPVNNGAVTQANVFQFVGGSEVANASGTQFVRQRFIFDEAHGSAIGSLFGVERLRRNAEGTIISFSYHGRFQFSLPEENTVFVGTFSTGTRVVNR